MRPSTPMKTPPRPPLNTFASILPCGSLCVCACHILAKYKRRMGMLREKNHQVPSRAMAFEAKHESQLLPSRARSQHESLILHASATFSTSLRCHKVDWVLSTHISPRPDRPSAWYYVSPGSGVRQPLEMHPPPNSYSGSSFLNASYSLRFIESVQPPQSLLTNYLK